MKIELRFSKRRKYSLGTWLINLWLKVNNERKNYN